MHPIERLRHVARIGPEHPALLARETAAALLSCADPADLVVACRRLLDRQPACGPIWWVAAHASVATEPERRLVELMDELDRDPTPLHLEVALVENPGHPVVEAWALGETGILTSAEAPEAEPGVWVVSGVGRALPARLWHAALERVERLGARSPAALVPPEAVSLVATPEGLVPFRDALGQADWPVPPELL